MPPLLDANRRLPGVGWILNQSSHGFQGGSAQGALSIKCMFGGPGRYKVGRARYLVDDEAYLILNEGQPYEVEVAPQVESFCVFFERPWSAALLRSLLSPADGLLDDPEAEGPTVEFFAGRYPHDAALSPRLLGLRRANRTGDVSSGRLEELAHGLLEALLQAHRDVYREVERLPAAKAATRAELYRRLLRARDYMDAQLHTALSLAEIASVANLSPHHFLRSFKSAFGETPHGYLTNRRLARAKRLLALSDEPVTEIGLELGFETPSAFSALFRRRFGLSPRAYRQNPQT